MRGALGLGIWVLGFSLSCASRQPEPFYVRVAEGLTSPTLTQGIDVAPRMLSSPQLVNACQVPRLVRRLETPTTSLELRVGERFPLNTLAIVAVNAADEAVLPAVPIAIEALETTPPVLQLQSDDPDLDQARIYPLNTGRFTLRVRTLCGVRPATLTIDGVVTP